MRNKTWLLMGFIFLILTPILFLIIQLGSERKTANARLTKVTKARHETTPLNHPEIKEGIDFYNYEGGVIGNLEKEVSVEAYCMFERNIDGVPTKVVPYWDDRGSGYVKAASLKLSENLNIPVADYCIQNQKAYRVMNGHRAEIPAVAIKNAGKSGRQYFMLSDSNLAKLAWEKQGSYFFDSAGKFLVFLPFTDIVESSEGLFFSPNEKYIAQDEGTWVIRDLKIFEFPDLKKIAAICYTGDFAWGNHDCLFFSTASNKKKPNCGVDDDSYHYVAMINLQDAKETPVMMFDELTEYYFEGISGNSLVLRKFSVSKIEDWGNFDIPWQEEEIRIPDPTVNIQYH